MPNDAPLPEFDDPPVIETVMAVRFRELPDFTSARVGQFWERHLVQDFPISEDRPPYAAPVERFGEDGAAFELQLKLTEIPPPTRAWFIGGNEVIQLQSDWFAWNWRRTDAEPDYIRYARGRERFEQWVGELAGFIGRELQKPLLPIQCEVTYVNHVTLTGEDLSLGPLGAAIEGIRPSALSYLPVPEGAQAAWSYLMPDSGRGRGRLHVSAASVADASSGGRGIRLVLTARGRPVDENIVSALAFLDQGHEWVVHGFKDVTSETMWNRWRLRKEPNGGR